MTNLEALQEWLDTHQCAIKGFTIDPDMRPTAEDVAGEILRSLQSLERGEYTVVAEIGSQHES